MDSNGAVYGVRGLYVADDSIVPIKVLSHLAHPYHVDWLLTVTLPFPPLQPDGNTQVPAYIMGSMIVKKIHDMNRS